ncbi:hypothetical protein ACTJIJ_23010 [Niabella sp. 22666]|uniref:hypothetical protein n=1 Tax=Niabella sp. 22666 TaxID=3453954 RepID=UPI003F868DC6
MVRAGAHITIGNWDFPYLVDAEIVEDTDSLTNTCRLSLPRKYSWEGKPVALGDEPLIKRKDKVIVKWGYDDVLKPQFLGYVKNIKPGVPVQIECEDYMLMLKQGEITKTFKTGTKLKQLLTGIMPGVEMVATDTTVGDWRINKATPARVLDELKSKLGIYSYFRLIGEGNSVRPVLYAQVGPYSVDHRSTHVFEFARNIIEYENLVYKMADDVRIKLKVINITGDNKKEEYETGDQDGEIRTVHYYKLDKATMKQRAEEDLKRYKYTGYQGTFTTFGEPSVRAGDIAHMIGNKYHPNGKYLIKKVTKTCGVSVGIRQVIELDRQLS